MMWRTQSLLMWQRESIEPWNKENCLKSWLYHYTVPIISLSLFSQLQNPGVDP